MRTVNFYALHGFLLLNSRQTPLKCQTIRLSMISAARCRIIRPAGLWDSAICCALLMALAFQLFVADIRIQADDDRLALDKHL